MFVPRRLQHHTATDGFPIKLKFLSNIGASVLAVLVLCSRLAHLYISTDIVCFYFYIYFDSAVFKYFFFANLEKSGKLWR